MELRILAVLLDTGLFCPVFQLRATEAMDCSSSNFVLGVNFLQINAEEGNKVRRKAFYARRESTLVPRKVALICNRFAKGHLED